MSKPFSGVRILDFTRYLAGPYGTYQLALLGADVVKIEHPNGGDNMRGHGPSKDGVPLWWKEISRNKRSVAVNLGTDAGAEVLRRLVRTADVMVRAPALRTPRMVMQRCSASITTITPRASRSSMRESATWVVSRSWTCGRLA